MRTSPPEPVRRFQVASAAALAVSAPLLHGGVHAWMLGGFVTLAAAAFLAEWIPRAVAGPAPARDERAWLGVAAVLSALVALQLMPLPEVALHAVGAYPAALLAEPDAELARIAPHPVAGAARWAAYGAGWAVAWFAARARRREAGMLAAAIGALALAEALYGLYAQAHGQTDVLGIWPRGRYRADATGTFGNRNHFAGFVALGWPLLLAWLAAPAREGGLAWPAPVRALLAGVASLFLGMAIVASHSRLGVVAAGVGIGVFAVCGIGAGRRAFGSSLWLRLGVPCAALMGAVWFGPGALLERFQALPRSAERVAVWGALLDLPPRTWILGAGVGAFADVFKTVQPVGVTASYAYAHSAVLEGLLDFGVLGVAALAWAMWRWWRCVRPKQLAVLQRGAAAAVAALAVHAVGDFHFQVPGTAFPFFVALGLCANAALARRDEAEEGRARPTCSRATW